MSFRARLRNLALSLVSITAALGVVECALRACSPMYLVGNEAAYEYDPDYGVRLKPGIHLFRTTDYQEEIRVNPLGTVNFQDDFTGYPAMIFALGDSNTQGTGSPSDAAYPFQLDLLLNRDEAGLYTKRYAVVNLGIAAFGGEQSLLALRNYTARLGKPAYALYLGADNDYDDDQLFKSGYRHRHLVDGSPYWGRMLGPVRWVSSTEVGKRLKIAVGVFRHAKVSAAAGAGPQGASVAELERSVLERLLQTCKDGGITPVVSWAQPTASYTWLKAWAAAHDVPFADWLPAVTSVQAAVPEAPLENHHSGGHNRGWVLRAVADAYRAQIQAHPRPSPAPPAPPSPPAP